MPLVTQTIKNLKGGISQQPDILRFPDQGEEQINGFSSEVEGLQKRPPTIHVRSLDTRLRLDSEKPKVQLINRDVNEQYYVVVRESAKLQPGDAPIEVYDLQGNRKTVNFPGGAYYATVENPREDIRMITVADYTFFVNRKVKVEMKNVVSWPGYGTRDFALINIKGGQYGRTYSVYIDNGLAGTFTTPKGTTAEDSNQIDTQFITTALYNDMVGRLGPSGVYGIAIGPNYIYIRRTDGNGMASIRTEDGFNGGLMIGGMFEWQRFNQLPAQAPDGYIAKVNGDPGSGADDYYVRYDARDSVWRETMRPGEHGEFNQASMPWALVREANGTFTFRANTWQGRPAGDGESSPEPSFVDQRINDVFFWRNRLGLLSGENIILSQSGEFFKFWPKSVVAAGDSDPIDVAVSHSRVSTLNHAVPFSEEMLLWSDQTQFIMRSDGVLSTKSIKVDAATEFESSINARPVAAGRGVYFAAPRASFTSVRRYYAVADVSAVKNAEDVSAHVPSYIPNGVFDLGSSTTENVVTALSAGAESRIYLYKYLYLDEQLVQQSWSHWEFGQGSRVLACDMVGAVMFLLIAAPSGLFLERLEFTQNTKDITQEPYRLHMDRKIVVPTAAITYDRDTNVSTINMASVYGASPKYGNYWVVEQDGRAHYAECPAGGWGVVNGRIHVPGLDLTTRTVIIGEEYVFSYTFSKFLIKVQDGSGGIKSEDVGRLQIRRAWVNYNNSGHFNVRVCGRFSYDMTGKKLGEYVLGEEPLNTGQFRFPVGSNVERCRVVLSSNGPGPVALIGGGWIGEYFRREQAI